MRTRTAAATIACAAILAVACGGGGGDSLAGQGPTAVPRSADPRLRPRTCDVPTEVMIEVECSWLVVPMDRADPDGTQVRLPVAVLRSPAPEPADDPVVFLQGGPGFGTVDQLSEFAGAVFLAQRDIVLFDQRGVGSADPALDCPELDTAAARTAERATDFATELELRRGALADCRDRLEAEGIDLGAFHSEASAADLADLRIALGVDEWNLWAASYGTRMALTTLRSHPEGIRSVILDSAYPTTVGRLEQARAATDRAVAEVAAGCADHTACATAIPDVEAAIAAAVARFDAEPVITTLMFPGVGPTTARLTGSDAYSYLIGALASSTPDAVPALARDLAGANVDLSSEIAQAQVTANARRTEGAFLSIECADSAQGLRGKAADALLAAPGPLAGYVLELAEPYCDVWGVTPLGPAFNRPVRTDVPVLVLAGAYDPLTPATDGAALAGALPNATFVEFDGRGHALTAPGTARDVCTAVIAGAFVAEPDEPLDTSCVNEIGPEFNP